MANLVEVENLRAYYITQAYGVKRTVKAVDGISMTIREGEVYGIAGESGCGKTTVGKAILQLIKPTAGSAQLDGRELCGLARGELRPLSQV